MELPFLDALPLAPEAKQQVTTILLGLVIAAGLLFGARLVAGVIKGTLRWSVVARGCRPIPAAPGGGLLGHALQLATARCPWEKMLEWAQAKGPLVRFNILQRTGLIVNDPQAVKRIFQVGCSCRRRCHCCARWRVAATAPATASISQHCSCVSSPLPASIRPDLQYPHAIISPADQAAAV